MDEKENKNTNKENNAQHHNHNKKKEFRRKRKPRLLIELNDFSKINDIKKPEHTKVKVAIYCNTCKRKHHLHFGEFKNGSVHAKDLQDITDKYCWKYCNRDREPQIIKIYDANYIDNNKNITNFINILKNIKGSKIVTITTSNYSQAFDINKDFQFIDIASEHLFYKILKEGILKGTGIIIRQFLDIKTKKIINNKEIWIPKKKLYGFFLYLNNIFPTPKEDLEIACNTDAETGLPLEPENDVIYAEINFNYNNHETNTIWN